VNQRPAIMDWRQYPVWARGPARVVGDKLEGEVILDEQRAEYYPIFGNSSGDDLPFDLAGLSAPGLDKLDDRDVVAFVKRHGLLRHAADDVGSGECREPLMDYWVESRIIAVVMNLYNSLHDAANTGACSALRQWVGEAIEIGFDAEPEADDDELMEQASVYLAELISEQLGGSNLVLTSTTQLEVEPKSPHRFLMTYKYPNLLAAAYGALAIAFANRILLAECPGCGRLFLPQSGKQKYCKPSCASTSRWRRWKAAQPG
jgi:hypothetical protein